MTRKPRARGRRRKDRLEISDAEWEVLKVVWKDQPCAAGDVQEALQDTKDWAYSTVKMTMNRMVEKGLLTFERVRNLQLFSASVTEDEARRREIFGSINRAFGGALAPTLQFLLKEEDLSKEDIRALRKILDKRGR